MLPGAPRTKTRQLMKISMTSKPDNFVCGFREVLVQLTDEFLQDVWFASRKFSIFPWLQKAFDIQRVGTAVVHHRCSDVMYIKSIDRNHLVICATIKFVDKIGLVYLPTSQQRIEI